MAPSADYAGRGVLLQSSAPGTIRAATLPPVVIQPEGRATLAKSVPSTLDNDAEPKKMAPFLAFPASADNHFMIGEVPLVDGCGNRLLRGDEPGLGYRGSDTPRPRWTNHHHRQIAKDDPVSYLTTDDP